MTAGTGNGAGCLAFDDVRIIAAMRKLIETPTKNPAAQALGRLGGAAKSPKQNAARRQNAQLAGRPRRVCVHCGAPVVGGHVDRDLDATCGQHGWRWQQGRDGVYVATGVTETLRAIAKIVRRRPRPMFLAQDHAERLRLISEALQTAGF